ncbi:hypothetical protein CTY75_01265 [Acinetobacter baumannii]|nr:hypothetical protein [Acinetobacter baumannii]
MQNDSNVETTQAEIKPFPRQLISDMWDSNVTFDTILHIPTLKEAPGPIDYFRIGQCRCELDKQGKVGKTHAVQP